MVHVVSNVLDPNVIASLRARRKLEAKHDCQGERQSNALLMSQIEGTAKALGIDLSVQTKERRERQHKEAWDEFTAACRHLFHVATKDPYEHAIKFIQDMGGKR